MPHNWRPACAPPVLIRIDDADTTAAIYGQIADTYYGVDGIPAEWREKIAMAELITELADELLRYANGTRCSC